DSESEPGKLTGWRPSLPAATQKLSTIISHAAGSPYPILKTGDCTDQARSLFRCELAPIVYPFKLIIGSLSQLGNGLERSIMNALRLFLHGFPIANKPEICPFLRTDLFAKPRLVDEDSV